MTDGPTSIPADVQALLTDHVGSHEELQVLLTLHGSPEISWSLKRVAEVVSAPVDELERALTMLCSSGLISRSANEFVYRAGPAHAAVERLAEVYTEDQIGVIMFLTANAVERIRTGAIRAFADSFVIKGKKNA